MRANITRILLPVCFLQAALTLNAAFAAPPEASPWQPDIETARRVAGQTNRLVLIHFWGTNCGPCMQMERDVFSQPETMKALLVNYVPVKLDTSAFPITAQQYGVTAIPTDVVTTPAGQVIQRRTGALAAKEYVDTLNMIAGRARSAPGAIAQANRPSTTAGANWITNPSGAPPNYPSYPTDNRANAATMPPNATAAQFTSPNMTGGAAATQGQPPWASQIAAAPTATPWAMAAPNTTGAPPAAATTSLPPMTSGATATAQPPWAANIPNNPSAPAPSAMAITAPPTAAAYHPTVTPVATQPQYQPPAASTGAAAVNPWGAAAAPTSTGTPPGYQAPVYSAPAVNPAATLRPVAPPASNPPAANTQTSSSNPPLGLDGYDAVRLVERRQWTAGDRKWGAIRMGKTYLFNGPEEQQKFLANPNAYSPALSGDDPVLKFDQAQSLTGHRQFGTFYNNRVYLFSSQESLNRFKENADRYAAEVRQAELLAGGNIRR